MTTTEYATPTTNGAERCARCCAAPHTLHAAWCAPTTEDQRNAAALAAKYAEEPTVEQVGRDGKSLRARWVLTRDEQGRPVEVTDLRVSHYGRPSYVYRATLNRATVSYGSGATAGVTSELSAPMSAVVVKDVPNATRYAKAAHRRAMTAALAVVLNPDQPDAFLPRFRADLGDHKDR